MKQPKCGCIININCPLHQSTVDMYEALKAIRILCNGYTELDRETTGLYIDRILRKAEGI